MSHGSKYSSITLCLSYGGYGVNELLSIKGWPEISINNVVVFIVFRIDRVLRTFDKSD